MSRFLLKSRRGLRPLFLISGLCVVSAGLRLADGSGAAIAREVASLTGYEEVAAEVTGEAPDTEVSEILDALATREAQLIRREEELAARQAALSEAQEKMRIKLEELKAAEDSLRAVLDLAEGAADNDISRLTTVYERMKPKEAAALFETMAPEFAAGFLGRMNPEAAAQILAGLSPEAAYSLSAILAGRHTDVPKE